MSLQCVLRSAVASFTLLPCVRIKLQCISRLERKRHERDRVHRAQQNGRETNIDRAKMAEVSKITTEKQDDP